MADDKAVLAEEDGTDDVEYLRSFIKELRQCNKDLQAEADGLRTVVQLLSDGLLFVPHPIVQRAHAVLAAVLRGDPVAPAMAKAVRDDLLMHRRRGSGG